MVTIRSFNLIREHIENQPKPQRNPNEQLFAAASTVALDLIKTEDELAKAKQLVTDAMSALDDEIISIKSQIEGAQAEVFAGGQYSDPVWWRRVNGAARHKGKLRQELQTKLGEINRRIRAARMRENSIQSQSEERLFIAIAKLHLPPQTYERLWELTHETQRMRAGNDKD
jgi:hypothetical protein